VLNTIDPANISSAAQNLLQFIPLPNIATTASGQNFHTVTSGASTSDAVIYGSFTTSARRRRVPYKLAGRVVEEVVAGAAAGGIKTISTSD